MRFGWREVKLLYLIEIIRYAFDDYDVNFDYDDVTLLCSSLKQLIEY
jgi:hypothetical protein